MRTSVSGSPRTFLSPRQWLLHSGGTPDEGDEAFSQRAREIERDLQLRERHIERELDREVGDRPPEEPQSGALLEYKANIKWQHSLRHPQGPVEAPAREGERDRERERERKGATRSVPSPQYSPPLSDGGAGGVVGRAGQVDARLDLLAKATKMPAVQSQSLCSSSHSSILQSVHPRPRARGSAAAQRTPSTSPDTYHDIHMPSAPSVGMGAESLPPSVSAVSSGSEDGDCRDPWSAGSEAEEDWGSGGGGGGKQGTSAGQGDDGSGAAMMCKAGGGGGSGRGDCGEMDRGGAWDMERVASGGEIVHATGVRAQARAARREAYAVKSPSRDLTNVPCSGEHKAMLKLRRQLHQLLLVSQDLASHSRELGRGMQELLEENAVLRYSLQEAQNELVCAMQTQSHPAFTTAAGGVLRRGAGDEDVERGGERGERAQEEGREAALRALGMSLDDERRALVRERELMLAESEAARKELQEDRDELARERLL